MIYPAPARLPDPHAPRPAPRPLGLIEGVAEATASLMKMVSGWWSDRVRRRKPLVVAGYSIAAVARPLIGPGGELGARCSRSASPTGSARASARRRATRCSRTWSRPRQRGRAFGLQRAMDNAGAVVGPLLAALPPEVRLRGRALGLSARRDPGAGRRGPARLRGPRDAADREPAAAGRTTGPPARFPAASGSAIGIFVLFTLASSTDAFLLLRAQRRRACRSGSCPLLWAFFNGVKAAPASRAARSPTGSGASRRSSPAGRVYAVSYVGFAFVVGALADLGALRASTPSSTR